MPKLLVRSAAAEAAAAACTDAMRAALGEVMLPRLGGLDALTGELTADAPPFPNALPSMKGSSPRGCDCGCCWKGVAAVVVGALLGERSSKAIQVASEGCAWDAAKADAGWLARLGGVPERWWARRVAFSACTSRSCHLNISIVEPHSEPI